MTEEEDMPLKHVHNSPPIVRAIILACFVGIGYPYMYDAMMNGFPIMLGVFIAMILIPLGATLTAELVGRTAYAKE